VSPWRRFSHKTLRNFGSSKHYYCWEKVYPPWLTVLDHWLAACLAPLAVWILINGIDDLFLDLACFYRWVSARLFRHSGARWPGEADLESVPHQRIAIFVPLWKEYRVVQHMLEHNIAANRYDAYDFFVGVYPNDAPTVAAVREASQRFANVHLAMCPHDGPTSKADCLNWIYQRMLLHEEETGERFDIVVTHDAEDLIHPEALRLINYYGQDHDMVQIPVLALPTPFREFTHGVYCDEFAEYQTKDVPARQILGGFIPSNGVGTGFSRAALEKLAESYSNRIFEPECLTEDYENGFRVHRLGFTQTFVPIRKHGGSFVATREFFPRSLRAAVKQRTRWVMGIALQSWERHDWKETAGQLYWFWRDRKGLVGNLISPLANLIFVYGALTWFWCAGRGLKWGLAEAARPYMVWVYITMLALQVFHMSVRAGCVTRIYGWRFALGVPVRMIWGNWINCFATVAALRRYFTAKIAGRPLVWLKTDHAYPSRAALMEHKRRLGEVLVESDYLTPEDLESALAGKPKELRLGEYLVYLGKLTERELYEALSLQQNLPLEPLDAAAISRKAVRALPAQISRRWKVLPFKIVSGRLFLAGPELPSDEMSQELRRFSPLEIKFHLVTPTEYEALARQYLPKS
jgi:adsorption protein B